MLETILELRLISCSNTHSGITGKGFALPTGKKIRHQKVQVFHGVTTDE